MKPGTFVRLPDGREGTVVYHGLDGYGIRWGRIDVNLELLESVNPLFGREPDGWPYAPEAMLRDPYHGAQLECVGTSYLFGDELDDDTQRRDASDAGTQPNTNVGGRR